MTTYKITSDHTVVVTDEPIEYGDWFLNIHQNKIYRHNIKYYNVNKSYLKKIIQSTKPLDGVKTLNHETN